ncbi:MAG: uroporphyrinogen decarboxylase family protein [Kiritimatiellae bacterium]|nr:uroporphyrinogen decarboxylase family protein [Kiritimatiellia bacterium]
MQGCGFFSPDIFREFFKPYDRQVFDSCHRHGIHTWMHACGCVREFIPDWIDSGLDVLHPIQKHTMDELATYRVVIFIACDGREPWYVAFYLNCRLI